MVAVYSKAELKASADYEETVKQEVVEKWATHGIFQVVGNGEVTDSNPNSPSQCGKMYGFVGCVKTHLHNKTTLDGVNHKGNAYVKKRIRRCFNPRCPECYRSYAVREAKVAAWRTTKASAKYGRAAEHIIGSVPKSEYAIFEEGYEGYLKARARVHKILESRGVIGGGLILHGFRFANAKESRVKGVPFGWYWSPHWHVIGFLSNGYSCRDCVHNCDSGRGYCLECKKGFEGRTRRAYEKDGWIVKVAEKRKSILGTFFYQLEHSTIIPSKNRFHSLTWFGVAGIRALKLDISEFKEAPDLCPICGSKCVPLKYLAHDLARIEKEFWIKEFEEPAFDKDGLPIWIEKQECDSGGYACY